MLDHRDNPAEFIEEGLATENIHPTPSAATNWFIHLTIAGPLSQKYHSRALPQHYMVWQKISP